MAKTQTTHQNKILKETELRSNVNNRSDVSLKNSKKLYLDLISNTNHAAKKKGIELVWQAIITLANDEAPDLSIRRVGQKSEELGGPREQTIRNKGSKHYRDLIEAAGKDLSIPIKKISAGPLDNLNTAVKSVSNPQMRSLLQMMLDENKRLKTENNRLREHLKDHDIPMQKPATDNELFILKEQGEQDPLLVHVLQTMLSDNWMEERGWTLDENGSVVTDSGQNITPAGFEKAARRFLAANYEPI